MFCPIPINHTILLHVMIKLIHLTISPPIRQLGLRLSRIALIAPKVTSPVHTLECLQTSHTLPQLQFMPAQVTFTALTRFHFVHTEQLGSTPEHDPIFIHILLLPLLPFLLQDIIRPGAAMSSILREG